MQYCAETLNGKSPVADFFQIKHATSREKWFQNNCIIVIIARSSVFDRVREGVEFIFDETN